MKINFFIYVFFDHFEFLAYRKMFRDATEIAGDFKSLKMQLKSMPNIY